MARTGYDRSRHVTIAHQRWWTRRRETEFAKTLRIDCSSGGAGIRPAIEHARKTNGYAVASVSVLSVALAAFACQRPARSGDLIDRYTHAECIPWRVAPDIATETRSWDYTVQLQNGESAHISGYRMPGGRIDVEYGARTTATAANAGDYIPPADVRIDRQHERLYVKADGSAGGWRPETWLFDYDLRQRRENGRLLVDPRVLPPECAAAAGGK
jgi:hypothetical protein